MNSATPPIRVRLRPKASPSRPPSRIRPPKVSRYAVIASCAQRATDPVRSGSWEVRNRDGAVHRGHQLNAADDDDRPEEIPGAQPGREEPRYGAAQSVRPASGQSFRALCRPVMVLGCAELQSR